MDLIEGHERKEILNDGITIVPEDEKSSHYHYCTSPVILSQSPGQVHFKLNGIFSTVLLKQI